MANYKGHIAGSIIFFLAGLALLSPICVKNEYIPLLLSTLIGALFPDLDTKSKGRNIFKKLLPIIIIILIIKNDLHSLLLTILFFSFSLFVGHRGIFHRTWFLCLNGLLFTSLIHTIFATTLKKDLLIWAFFLLGSLSHLVLDYAFPKKRI